jgi:hypothetical protein
MGTVRRGLSSGLAIATTCGAFAAPALVDEPADAAPAVSHDPVFEVPVAARRVACFMRALRAGKGSLLVGGWIRPGFTGGPDTRLVVNHDDASRRADFVEAQLNAS